MTLLEALELVASLVPGLGPAVRAIRLLRIAVRIAELVRRRSNASDFELLSSARRSSDEAELRDALDELEREERAS